MRACRDNTRKTIRRLHRLRRLKGTEGRRQKAESSRQKAVGREPPLVPLLLLPLFLNRCNLRNLRINKKGNRLCPFPFTLVPLPPDYAGAGLPPVIGGRIGFNGLTAGSFNCGLPSSLPWSGTG